MEALLKTLIEKARELNAAGIFLGGPIELFETAGRKTLITLLSEGLMPYSKVLDIGCGCLRVGYWLINFLDRGCYFGIEPNIQMLNAGIGVLVEPDLIQTKKPEFNHNSEFDFAAFQEGFDFLVARSIWTHCTKQQIQTMLDGFLDTTNPEAKFITSYVRPSLARRDYMGTKWVGRNHESDIPGVVSHSLRWIRTESAKRGLVVDEINDEVRNFGNQTWLRFRRRAT